jgi:small subunit ribosomal protein S2
VEVATKYTKLNAHGGHRGSNESQFKINKTFVQILRSMEDKLIKDILEVGGQFGYNKTKRHPSTKSYIFGTKNNADIIDVTETAEMLEKAINFVKKLAEEKKTILFVSSKPEAKKIMEMGAKEINMPYVENRWIGGTLTNFSQISKRINVLIDLKNKKEKGELEKYTKKERSDFDRKIEKMSKSFGGLISLTKKPDAIFIIDSKKETIALTEANIMKIPVISLSNTDNDLSNIDYPIIGNDASRTSVQFFVNKIVEAYKS